MDKETIDLARSQAEICRIFGNPNRVLILWALGKQEMSVSAIALLIGASLQNTSQHLRLMKDKNILISRREGNAIYYQIATHTTLPGCPVFAIAKQRSCSE